MIRVISFILVFIAAFQPSFGLEFVKKEKFLCQPTKRHNVAIKPITYDPSYTDNDTTKNAGEFDDLYLDKILITGVVKDKRCVAIPNASIEIWQEDECGKRRYNQYSYSFTDRYQLNMEQYSNFLGIATTTSDNNGHFSFISVIPNGKFFHRKRKAKRQSLINIAVSHPDFPELESQIILNSKAPIKQSNRRIVAFRNLAGKTDSMPSYNLEIILDGTNKYKTY